jgi:CBS domain-containing protein
MRATPYARLLARDVMVTDLVTLRPEMDAVEAIRTLLKHRISGAPVIDADGNYLGVFSERNSLQALVGLACEQLPSTHVGAYMNTDRGCTIGETVDLLNIARMFLEQDYRRLPVLRGNRLVGQISRRDVLRAALVLIDDQPHAGDTTLLYLSALVERREAPFA